MPRHAYNSEVLFFSSLKIANLVLEKYMTLVFNVHNNENSALSFNTQQENTR